MLWRDSLSALELAKDKPNLSILPRHEHHFVLILRAESKLPVAALRQQMFPAVNHG